MRYIYKGDRMGEINGQLHDNQITGVFGTVLDITKTPRDNPNLPNILTSTTREDEYEIEYTTSIISDVYNFVDEADC